MSNKNTPTTSKMYVLTPEQLKKLGYNISLENVSKSNSESTASERDGELIVKTNAAVKTYKRKPTASINNTEVNNSQIESIKTNVKNEVIPEIKINSISNSNILKADASKIQIDRVRETLKIKLKSSETDKTNTQILLPNTESAEKTSNNANKRRILDVTKGTKTTPKQGKKNQESEVNSKVTTNEIDLGKRKRTRVDYAALANCGKEEEEEVKKPKRCRKTPIKKFVENKVEETPCKIVNKLEIQSVSNEKVIENNRESTTTDIVDSRLESDRQSNSLVNHSDQNNAVDTCKTQMPDQDPLTENQTETMGSTKLPPKRRNIYTTTGETTKMINTLFKNINKREDIAKTESAVDNGITR